MKNNSKLLIRKDIPHAGFLVRFKLIFILNSHFILT